MSSSSVSPEPTPPAWWREAVFYQVYPRSFADSDGDGEGDLPGLTARLPDLVELGVDALWLTPFQPSPMIDGGYDVADYTGVDARYGTVADVADLIARAHAEQLRVTIDLVPNHCSSQHPWFRAAAADPAAPERARFLIRPGRGRDGELPPTNWRSVFGGPSWTRLPDGQWYYHLFAPEQPDLNWANPSVPAAFEQVLRTWLRRGVDGFRIDVADALVKDFAAGDTADGSPVIPKGADSPLHGYYRRLASVLAEFPGDRMAVLETGTSAEEVALLLRPDEMHLAFDLALTKARWRAEELRAAIAEGLAVSQLSGRPATWVLENHDLPRAVTRFGHDLELSGEYVPEHDGGADADPGAGAGGGPADANGESAAAYRRGVRRARAAAVLLLTLPGAVYLYQGQELGLPEVADIPPELRQDPVFRRSGGALPGRDGCRVPLPWSGSAPPYGFGPPGSTPWLPQPPAFAALTRERQRHDPTSMLALYRNLLALRREHPALRRGRFEWYELGAASEGPQAFGYRVSTPGERLTVIVSTGARVRLPAGRILLASRPDAVADMVLEPDGAVVIDQAPDERAER